MNISRYTYSDEENQMSFKMNIYLLSSLVPLYYLVCLVSADLICIQHFSFGNRLWA